MGRLRPDSQLLEVLRGQQPQIQAAIILAHLDALPASPKSGNNAEEVAALTAEDAKIGMQDTEAEISGCFQVGHTALCKGVLGMGVVVSRWALGVWYAV